MGGQSREPRSVTSAEFVELDDVSDGPPETLMLLSEAVLRQAPACHGSRTRRVVVVATALISITGAVAVWMRKGIFMGRRSDHLTDGAVGDALQSWGLSTKTYFVKSYNNGCSNWQHIQISSGIATSVIECFESCKKLGDCKMFNFQAVAPTSCGGEGAIGTCSLLKGGCSQIYDDCFDLYYLTTKVSSSYASELINSKALNDLNEGLEESRVKMNQEIPEKLEKLQQQHGYAIKEGGVSIPMIQGASSAQVTVLKGLRSRTSALKGWLQARVIMRAVTTQPVVVPKASIDVSPGITLDFKFMLTGGWMSALEMDAEIETGPPLALKNLTVNTVGAGYEKIAGGCLEDMLEPFFCDEILQYGLDESKVDLETDMRTKMQAVLQDEFSQSVPMYEEIQPDSGYCYQPSIKCLKAVQQARTTGISKNSSKYNGLNAKSPPGEFQTFLYQNFPDETGCVPYCDTAPTPIPYRRLEDEFNTEHVSRLTKILFRKLDVAKIYTAAFPAPVKLWHRLRRAFRSANLTRTNVQDLPTGPIHRGHQ